MRRGARDNGPHGRPPERIELEGGFSKGRLAAALLLLGIGIACLVYAFSQLLLPQAGWQTIEAGSAAGPTSGEEFTFLYNSGSSQEAKAVAAVYTGACRKSFQLFHSSEEFEDAVNVASLNSHPNEALEVDPVLYRALAAFAESGRRELYLGPVYERYEGLFSCEDDSQLAYYDPRLSEEVRAEYEEVLAFANDPQAVSLELLGENRVRLAVSPAYLAWAEERGVVRFLDFSWMRNAFVADYLAEELTAAGYTKGSLSSYDGFSRNLDGSGEDYTYTIYHREGGQLYHAADFHYQGPAAFVRMRDYPLREKDLRHYRTLSGGEVRSSYLDVSDALCKSAVDTLVCYSREKSCAQMLLKMIPVYIADDFREESVAALAGEGIDAIYCQTGVVRYTEADARLEDLYAGEDVRYRAERQGT